MMKTLKSKKIGIIGFNARPIAVSVKKLDGMTFVSDYWGDLDLAICSDEAVTVLNPIPGIRQRGSLENPVHFSLAENFLNAFSEVDFDHIFIGSGFDDHPESLIDIEKQFGLSGNSIAQITKARDKNLLRKIIRKYDVSIPRSIYCTSKKDVLNGALEIGFPCVIRPLVSGGGSGIKVFVNQNDLEIYLERRKKHDLIVQELLNGHDVSASVIGTGIESRTISVQNQLIGLPSVGRNCDFVYCGNSIPFSKDKQCQARVAEISEEMITDLGLLGSNGIDFVVTAKQEIIFMEINPRIQGTLEMLEMSGNVSVLQFHLDALDRKLPMVIPKWQPTIKMVAYSRFDGHVPDLSKFPTSVDRSPTGVVVYRGDPICTIVERAPSLKEAYASVVKSIRRIQFEAGRNSY